MPILSVVIPAYNESKSILTILSKIETLQLTSEWSTEVIVVNDCSKDNTAQLVTDFIKDKPNFKLISNEINSGKSQTVKKGILHTTGDWVVVQDADLKYDPEDIVFILENTVKNHCDVGYGNRFGLYNGVIYWKNFIGNIGLSFISNLFTIWRLRVYIPDMEVCYKLIKGDILREIAPSISSASNFGIEPELTARLAKYHSGKNLVDPLKFIILPIKYNPRSIAEGKKMKAFRDGFKALFEIIAYNTFKN